MVEKAQRLDPVTIRGSALRSFLWAAISLAIAWFLFNLPGGGAVWQKALPFLFVGGGVIILITGRTAMVHMDKDGLSYQFLFRKTTVAWQDITSFYSSMAGIIGFDYRIPGPAFKLPGDIERPYAIRKGTIPGEFVLKRKQLLSLMEIYRAAVLRD